MFKEDDVLFNRFRIVKRVAFGAFSLVYKVIDQQSENQPIKCLKIEKIEDDGQPMINHEFLVAKAFDSDLICKAYDYFDDGNYKAVSMELLSENLSNTRRMRKNPPSIPMLTYITLQCLKGLNIMHQKNFVHCDVKPSNFAFKLSSNDYSIVTFDFGLSKYDGESPDITEYRNKLVRNPRYLSINSHNTNTWSKTDDIYSLIYSIAEFWKDELPWDGRTTNKLVYDIKNGFDMKKILPKELHILVDCANLPTVQIIEKIEEVFSHMHRNIEEEIHYITDPKDPGLKPKLIKYVFEKSDEKKFTNKHSA